MRIGEHASEELAHPPEGAPDERPFLILVSSFARSSREYFLTSLGSRYRLWLFLGGPGRASQLTWEQPYLVGHTVLDTLDADAMTAEAKRLDHLLRSDGADQVAGIICYDESRIVATAAVAQALGLPTSPVEAVERCRDKHLTRLRTSTQRPCATLYPRLALSATSTQPPSQALEHFTNFGDDPIPSPAKAWRVSPLEGRVIGAG